MSKPTTGPGKYFIKVDSVSDVIRAWLYNYDIDGAAPKAAHLDLLNHSIGPVLRDGGSIKLLGLASTTGQALHDKQLGESRIQGVLQYLQSHVGNKFTVSREVSFGKQMALAFGQEHLTGGTGDNTESELWRAVVINAWNRSSPPPPPIGVDVPFKNSTWADTASKVLDSVSIGLGIIDLAADLGELAALAGVTGPAGLVVSVVGSIVGMPLMWANADALANTNGQIQGAADAIQDMADQYSNPLFDSTPMSRWPAVKVPSTHVSSNPQPTVSEQAWRNGQVKGLESAVQAVLNLEQHPKPFVTATGKHLRISGRLWLRAISKAFGDNAGVQVVVVPANDELKKKGRPPFPTH